MSAGASRAYGPYVVVRELARGGMGAVHEVRHTTTGASYALKTLLPGLIGEVGHEELLRFRREAEVLGQLEHPNVARIHTASLDGPEPYLVQDLLTGGTLKERVLKGQLGWERAVEVIASLADALAYCHERGILHRDLKPENVIFDERDVPKLVDFGLALDAEATQRLTASGTILGTPAYMAPEQAFGGAVDRRTDVYGLSGILYFLLCGRPPFQGRSVVEVLTRLADEPPAPPRAAAEHVPAWLEAVCLRGLAKAPEDRFDDMQELAHVLGEGGSAEAPPGTWRLVAAGVVGLVLVVALGVGLLGDPAPAKLPAAPPSGTEDPPPADEVPLKPAVPVDRPLLVIPCESLTRAQFLADGSVLAGGHYDSARPTRRIRIVDGIPSVEAVGGTSNSGSLAVSRDGKRFAVAHGRRVTVWDLEGPQSTFRNRYDASALEFLPNGALLVGGKGDVQVCAVAEDTGVVLAPYPHPGVEAVCGLAAAPDGSAFVALVVERGAAGPRAFLGREDGISLQPLKAGPTESVTVSPSGHEFAFGHRNGMIGRYDVRTESMKAVGDPELKAPFADLCHVGRVQAMVYVSEDVLLSIGSAIKDSRSDFEIACWRIDDRKPDAYGLARRRHIGQARAMWIDLSQDGERLLVVRQDVAKVKHWIEIWATRAFLPED